MLSCLGFRMFRGTMTIIPYDEREPYDKRAVWMYKPQSNNWYSDDGYLYGGEQCKVKEDETSEYV